MESKRSHDAVFTQLLLPLPSRRQRIFERVHGLPPQHLVGFVDIAPHFLDVSGTTRRNFVVEFHAGALFERVDQFKHADALARSDVENLNRFGVFAFDNACHGRNVGFGEVHHVDKVTNARSVGRIVVVAEDSQLFADANRRLCEVRDEVGRRAVGHFANERRGVCADGVEVAKDDG